jgi:16S rRNA (guanine1207-N2)-methyltransferase
LPAPLPRPARRSQRARQRPQPPAASSARGDGRLEEDPYYKKTVTPRLDDVRLELRVAADLFSSFAVDVGTRLLLRTLTGPAHQAARRVLDLGCGYGPIGLGLKALNPGRIVHMVDRDALAVVYSQRNAERNGLSGVEVYGSLGYDDVRAVTGFDLIASNLPAKAGPAAIRHFLLDAAPLLRPSGLVAVVVVAPLRDTVAGVLARPGIEVVHQRATASYAVFHYRFTGGDGQAGPARRGKRALARGVYDRQQVTLARAGVRVTMHTAYGLPEFDSLGYQSELAVDALAGLGGAPVGRAVVHNPGQGHVPALLWALREPAELHLVDRDLLALRYSRNNLVRNGCPPERIIIRHQIRLAGASLAGASLVVALLREKEPPEAAAALVRQAVAELPPGGRLVVAASSTAVTRCLDRLGPAGARVAVRDRTRRKGFSAVVLERTGTG